MKAFHSCLPLIVLAGLSNPTVAQEHSGPRLMFNMERQPLRDALIAFAQQTGVQFLLSTEHVAEATAPRVTGTLTPAAALEQLLAETGLKYEFINSHTVKIRLADAEATPASVAPGAEAAESRASDASSAAPVDKKNSDAQGPVPAARTDVPGIPEILVQGAKIFNADIKRTRDDVQPYVVFSRETIAQSGEGNVEDFLKRRLTMLTSVAPTSQLGNIFGNTSSFNLRGLGQDETLVLVDGRRLAGHSIVSGAQQPDVNGIPLGAIERIEILPTTASGIYGGAATGGVINIILRRDYTGIESKVSYANTFDGGGETHSIDVSAGFAFGGGKTNLLIAGSFSDADYFPVQEREFVQRARAHILAVNPSALGPTPTNPPLGRTTNIRSTSGANLTLKGSGTPLNSPITSVPVGYSGPASDGGAALVANAGAYNLDLAPSAQGGGGLRSLRSAPKIETLSTTLRHQFTPRLQGFVEVAASNNSSSFVTSAVSSTFVLPANAPNNPFNEQVRITTPAVGADAPLISTLYSRRAVGGLVVELADGWNAALDFNWNRTRFYAEEPGLLNSTAATNAVRSGALSIFGDPLTTGVDFSSYLLASRQTPAFHSTVRESSLRTSGTLWKLPGGPLTVSMSANHREESFDDFIQIAEIAPGLVNTGTAPSRSQTVNSIYLEARLPLVSPSNAIPAVKLLELQVAARHDEYTTKAANLIDSLAPEPINRVTHKKSSTDPTIGLRYSPIRFITFRASYGTGFLPANVSQLAPNTPVFITPADAVFLGLTDPLRGGEIIEEFTYNSGGNPDLQPEQSVSHSAGMIFEPGNGFRLSIDWTKIKKDDEVINPLLDQFYIDSEPFIPGIVTRAPPQGDGFAVGPIVEFNGYLLNVARTEVEALDFALEYSRDVPLLGNLTLSAFATRQLHATSQLTSGSPVIENAGVRSNVKWKGNLALALKHRSWSFEWTTRYYDEYWLNAAHSVNANQGSATIPSQTYHDFFAGYGFGRSNSWLDNTQVGLSIRNVFNKEPPVDVSISSFYSEFADPRMGQYSLFIRKAF